ncbi:MAG: hypothetical protein IKY23_04585 [Lachnospiraceae bacterium]|nr:hypothetical protein [Lachnospiraceae bacterium]
MKKSVWSKLYNKIQKFLSLKNITFMTLLLFILLLVPVCYLSFFNRASGDDYGYGAYTRAAFMSTHSLAAVWKAIVRTIRQYYYGWQGTWFSIFLFALQPEVFSDKAYVITAFLMLFLWIGSTVLLFKEVLLRRMKMDKCGFWLITMLFLIISIQYVPSTASSIYWYNGCAHYLIPFAMAQFTVYLCLRFTDAYQLKYMAGSSVLMILLGGANYQAALFVLIAAVYIGIWDFLKKKKRQIFYLLVPVILEIPGLIVSIKAPGNKIRGGEAFGFSVSKVAGTIGKSFVKGFTDILTYLNEKPVMWLVLFAMFLLLLEIFKKSGQEDALTYPAFRILALICLYAAMQAPEIFAGVEVSGGVKNMNYWCFLLMMLGCMVIVCNILAKKIRLSKEQIHKYLVIPGMVLCLVLVILVKGNLKETTTYKCIDYIVTGQAADYREQMDLQTKLLTDETAEHVVVPAMNPEQGPFMHMQITPNEDAWINGVVKQFYEKESVVSIPRPEWMELYGAQ